MRTGVIVFDDVMERLRSYLEQRNNGEMVHDKEIADALDMRPAAYSNAKKRNSVPLEAVANYCARNRISLNWILYGQPIAMLDADAEESYMVRLLNEVRASAGGGAYNDNPVATTYLTMDKDSWQKLGIKQIERVEAIRVTGDSMEPTLGEDELILIDRASTEAESGGIYVIHTQDGVIVKRLLLGSDGWVIHSDNTNYPPQRVGEGAVSVIGKVVGVLEKR